MQRTEVTDWMGEKGAIRPCEACGAQQWMVPHLEDGDKDAAIQLHMIVNNQLTDTVGFTPAMCVNCGNTRLFHIDAIKAGRK